VGIRILPVTDWPASCLDSCGDSVRRNGGPQRTFPSVCDEATRGPQRPGQGGEVSVGRGLSRAGRQRLASQSSRLASDGNPKRDARADAKGPSETTKRCARDRARAGGPSAGVGPGAAAVAARDRRTPARCTSGGVPLLHCGKRQRAPSFPFPASAQPHLCVL
jgi:hypothetical protein